MIETFVAGLRANACEVIGPLPVADARRVVVEHARGLVAVNGDVPIPGLVCELEDGTAPLGRRMAHASTGGRDRHHRRVRRGGRTGDDRARGRARIAARDEPHPAGAHMCGARRRRRRDARRRARPRHRFGAAECAHVDRRTEPDRRPRDDLDARSARSPAGRGRPARPGVGSAAWRSSRRCSSKASTSARSPVRPPASTSPARSSRPRCPRIRRS